MDALLNWAIVMVVLVGVCSAFFVSSDQSHRVRLVSRCVGSVFVLVGVALVLHVSLHVV